MNREGESESETDALQFRQFMWRAMREMEHDKELRREGGGVRASEKLRIIFWSFSLQPLHQTPDIKVTW